ncbi:MAG: 4-hydroxy-tetrahydrodipicolinate reductase [Puniceicoccales bacterium]|jgi:4-hydroxy-tetrahydrodipicolinate reductase|nr:4-hydroxy-tetrahydrodipicolinate reductase [Puniceicoccales bacterium]
MVNTNLHLIISGFGGKMGKCIRALLAGTPAHVYDARHCLSDCLQPLVWVDFSNSNAFEQILENVQKKACPLVMGTTGLSKAQMRQLVQLSKKQAVVYDSNFSIGANILKKLVHQAGSTLKDFSVTIFEAHHSTKKDQPSGTAKSLRQVLLSEQRKRIPILSLRGGGIRGEHSVIFSGMDEMLSLKHEVLDRKVFAQGALCAVEWIIRKKPSHGLFNMQDVLAA